MAYQPPIQAPNLPALPDQGEHRAVENIYVGRTVRVLYIFETEVEMLASHNTHMASYFSGASAAFSLALGICINRSFYSEVPPAAEFLMKFGLPFLGIVCVFCLWMGFDARKRRRSILDIVKLESPRIMQPTIPQ